MATLNLQIFRPPDAMICAKNIHRVCMSAELFSVDLVVADQHP
jgi:hypothetical protein